MRLFVSAVAFMSVLAQPVLAQPVFAQSAAPRTAVPSRTPTSAEIEKGIGEAARNLETMSRIMAIMGPGLSRAMQSASPGIGRAVDSAQPSLGRAMAIAEPQLEAMGSRMATGIARTPSGGPLSGADIARSMQDAASNIEGLSRILGSVAPELGKAYDAAAPELRGALAQARPALEGALKAAEPELRRLAPTTSAKPIT
jgi:hypothetical protein